MSDNNVLTESELSDLLRNQDIRKMMIQELTKDGKIPAESSEKSLLVSMLDGSDRSTLSRAKLRLDKAKEENTKNTLTTMAQILKGINSRDYVPPRLINPQRELPEDLPDRTYVEGELEIGNEPVALEHVMGKT